MIYEAPKQGAFFWLKKVLKTQSTDKRTDKRTDKKLIKAMCKTILMCKKTIDICLI